MEILRKTQKKMPDIENTIIEIKNPCDALIHRLDTTKKETKNLRT